MLTALSLSAVCAGYAGLAGYELPSSAISDESSTVREAASRLLRDREKSASLFGEKGETLASLGAAVSELVVDDDQLEVQPLSQFLAERLILALPDNLPAPDISIDPDGEICLTWLSSGMRMFSVSVSTSERLAFAWVDGSDRGHGVARFLDPRPPTAILERLSALGIGHAALVRAA